MRKIYALHNSGLSLLPDNGNWIGLPTGHYLSGELEEVKAKCVRFLRAQTLSPISEPQFIERREGIIEVLYSKKSLFSDDDDPISRFLVVLNEII